MMADDGSLRRLHDLLLDATPNGSSPQGILIVSPEGTRIWVYVASQHSKNPGEVMAVEYGAKEYQRFGFILPNGSWDRDQKWNRSKIDVAACIREFMTDPLTSATSQGAKSGMCAFCGGSSLGEPSSYHTACTRRFGIGDPLAVASSPGEERMGNASSQEQDKAEEHAEDCDCFRCDAMSWQSASKIPCDICSDWDDLCESCQGLQDAFDASDDSYPGYYD